MSDQEADDEHVEDEEQTADDAEEESTDGIQDGEFVRLAYTARTVEDDMLVDTTDPEVAEEEGVADENQSFEPRIVVMGAGHLFDPMEEEIIGGEAGDEGTVVVPCEEAFGEFDEDQVRTISADKIPDDDRVPGGHVEIDGQHGRLETIIGGRARVDFNHPLAGDDIEYDYEILDVIEDRVEQAKGLLSTHIDMELDMRIETDEVEELQPVEPDEDEAEADDEDEEEDSEPEYEEVTVEKETLYVESSPQLAFNQQWMFQKQQIAQEIMDRLDLDRVIIQETIEGGPGMGMGGMMPGMGGGGAGLEEALEEADVDADELAEEIGEE